MTPLTRRTRWRVGLAVAAGLLAVAWWVLPAPPRGGPAIGSVRLTPNPTSLPATLGESTGPLSMAATGDSVIVKNWPEPGSDPGFDAVVAVLQRASFAVTNLEQILRESHGNARSDGWPVGSARTAADLRRAGFTIATRANNHVADEGDDGLRATSDVLEKAGLLHVGAGSDLDRARAPLFLGTAPRRIAVIAVTTSAADQARATRTREEIHGRPGVSALRYAAEVTADPATYATLAEIAHVAPADANSASGFHLSGRLVRKGLRTSVELVADQRDRDEILETITAARAHADVVVVTLHSHEPGNLSQAPAPFVRDFAHQAIDRGASVVVGTGPRQLRGIEIYQRRAIFYSLGNFAFDATSIPRPSADVYDANTNLDELALEALGQTAPPTLPAYDEPVWWESVVATGTFEAGGMTTIRLDPIDLGTDVPLKDRGRPRLAAGERGSAILRRLADLSKSYGTTIRIENGAGVIDLPF